MGGSLIEDRNAAVRTNLIDASRFRYFTRRWGVPLRVGVFVALIGLGAWGFTRLPEFNGRTDAGWNIAYVTLQLATFQFPSVDGSVPWQLQIARFALPLLTISEALNFLSGAALRSLRHNLIAPFTRPAMVAIGSSEDGMALVRQLHHLRVRCEVVASALSMAQQQELIHLNILSHIGPTDSPVTWARAQVSRAEPIFAVCGADIDNLAAAAAAESALGRHRPSRPRIEPEIHIGIRNAALAEEVLKSRDPMTRAVRWRRYSVNDISALHLLTAPPPAFFKPIKTDPTHILMIGMNDAAYEFFKNALIYCQDCAKEGPVITIFANSDVMSGYPLLRPGAVPSFIGTIRSIHWVANTILPDQLKEELAGTPPASIALVALPGEPALAAGLALHRQRKDILMPGGKIAVTSPNAERLSRALLGKPESEQGLHEYGAHVPNALLKRLLEHQDDERARAIHETYLQDQRDYGKAPAVNEEWENLKENFRDANRSAAAHITVKLASIGLTETDIAKHPSVFSEADLGWLSRIEHRRWAAERITQGWRFGEKTDRQARVHCDIVSYENLSKEDQAKDTVQVVNIPRFLNWNLRL